MVTFVLFVCAYSLLFVGKWEVTFFDNFKVFASCSSLILSHFPSQLDAKALIFFYRCVPNYKV